jgi:pseudaminic acid synthase
MSHEIRISGRLIGASAPPFIIAEMSGNHNQSLERALKIVDEAARTGAHALKIQTYTPESMTLNLDEREFHIDDPKSLWAGTSLFNLYKKAQTPYDWHQAIFERARLHGMIPFSTPFDATAVDFLEGLGVSCYKIASFENTDLDLIRRVAATKKPVIISTGMASISELGDTVNAARVAGCKDLILLKCTSTYPATPENSNLLTIPHMRELFECEVGLSDHTLGVGVSVASVALGATVIEKHFTLNREDGGVDSVFSMEPSELKQLIIETERAWAALGGVKYGPIEDELKSLQFRRTLYITKNLKAGDVLTNENVRAIRPGKGLPIKYMPIVLGKKVNQDTPIGTPLNWKLFG